MRSRVAISFGGGSLCTVTDVAFRDRGYEHAVHLSGETMISGVLAAARVGRGETVGLHFEPAGCMVFPHHDGGGNGSRALKTIEPTA